MGCKHATPKSSPGVAIKRLVMHAVGTPYKFVHGDVDDKPAQHQRQNIDSDVTTNANPEVAIQTLVPHENHMYGSQTTVDFNEVAPNIEPDVKITKKKASKKASSIAAVLV